MKSSRTAISAPSPLNSSFRDPAGFVFRSRAGDILRQVNQAGAEDFDLFIESGLYKKLTEKKLIVSHADQPKPRNTSTNVHAIIKPQPIPFISYPFEWSFSQLRDAALLTLKIQKLALTHSMSLKDASAYNVQFLDGNPIFIDTLSFEKYSEGEPWQAYRQFCQHFLAPLALMSYTDVRLSQLLRIYIDGIPLDLAAKLLPTKLRIKPGLAMHLFLHARAQKSKATDHEPRERVVKKSSLEAIVGSLERTILKFSPKKIDSEWGNYYENTNYTANSADEKAKLLKSFVKGLGVSSVLDLGGNDGTYSRVLNALNIQTICTDIDPNAVEANYRFVRQHKEGLMLPLLVDLTNPGGALGWHNDERELIHERFKTDAVMALALIHHLALSNNLPFEKIAQYFSGFGPFLVIEFVPKEDSQVQKLLATRKDIFTNYNETGFEAAFRNYYKLLKKARIKGTERILYLFEKE